MGDESKGPVVKKPSPGLVQRRVSEHPVCLELASGAVSMGLLRLVTKAHGAW